MNWQQLEDLFAQKAEEAGKSPEDAREEARTEIHAYALFNMIDDLVYLIYKQREVARAYEACAGMRERFDETMSSSATYFGRSDFARGFVEAHPTYEFTRFRRRDDVAAWVVERAKAMHAELEETKP